MDKIDPVVLRDAVLDDYVMACHMYPEKMGNLTEVSAELLLHDYATFSSLKHKWSEKEYASGVVDRLFVLLNNPPGLHRLVVDHLRLMWNDWLKPEWERVLPMLQESIAAYRKVEFRDMTPYEIVRAVTGRDMSGSSDLHGDITRVRMIPNAHLGPYLVLMPDKGELAVIFGARLPRGANIGASALGRSEMLVRLNALADDVRLRILELLTQHEELCAQDIIEALGLSQSSASRHLSQLSATGYIVERRREVAKCYSLNTERVSETARALTTFLSRR